MRGEGLADLKTAVNNLTGLDTSLTGQFSRFRAREQITILTFNDFVNPGNDFTIDDTNPQGKDMTQIRGFGMIWRRKVARPFTMPSKKRIGRLWPPRPPTRTATTPSSS